MIVFNFNLSPGKDFSENGEKPRKKIGGCWWWMSMSRRALLWHVTHPATKISTLRLVQLYHWEVHWRTKHTVIQ